MDFVDQLYDTGETANALMPYDDPVQNAFFGAAAVTGYLMGAAGEIGAKYREDGSPSILEAGAIGGGMGLAGGVATDALSEMYSEKDVIGAEYTSAGVVGFGVGTAGGNASVKGVREALSGDT
jgi:hypothetical protein